MHTPIRGRRRAQVRSEQVTRSPDHARYYRRSHRRPPTTASSCSASTPTRCSRTARRRSTARCCTCPGPTSSTASTRTPTAATTTLRNLAGSCSTTAGSRGTGYVSILPVDQGIEHSAGASFAPNPIYFDPEAIVELAIEGGCNAVASTLGVLGAVSRRYAHQIPFIVKLNHNELLTYPNHFDQVHVRERPAGLGAGRGRRRRDDLLRQRGVHAPDRRGLRRPSRRRTSSACSRCSGATCATPRSSTTASTTTSPPI